MQFSWKMLSSQTDRYALHVLQNQHKYGQMYSTMTLLKHLNNPNLFLHYEQYYIQSLHHEGKLIP
jgi:hydroxypyruvate isomerase